jgi:hypothetical protein
MGGAAYSVADDNPNFRGNPAGWHRPLVADGTTRAAADKDLPSLPSRHGCNRRDVLPNSIPIHPSPKAGYLRAGPRFQFLR